MGIQIRTIAVLTSIFVSVLGHSQSLSAVVLDANSKRPLESVTVYYDGTTIGTVTNEMGRFNLRNDLKTEVTVVISYLGYEAQYFKQDQLSKITTIYLSEKPETLDAVVLETDPWSREKKLAIFRREFLGRERAAKDCKILNEDDISLIYRPSTNTLRAYADRPIIIKNLYLGYQLEYSITDFEVTFKTTSSGIDLTETVYVAGSSIFRELYPNPKKRFLRARMREYLGSQLHFMRALTNEELEQEKFSTFIVDTTVSKLALAVNPYDYLKVETINLGKTKVTAEFQELIIRYMENKRSGLHPKNESAEIIIDDFGVPSPPDAIWFSGDFGIKRIATMLPANYGLETDS